VSLLVRGVRLIDGVADAARDHIDVLVEDERIASVGPHDPDLVVDPGRTVVVEGAGRTLVPGLIDAHAHYTFDPTEGSLQAIMQRSDEDILDAAAGHAGRALRAGITTARGAGSIRNLECRLRDAIAAGGVAGPRIVAAGTAVGAIGGHGSAFGLGADGPDALAAATREVVNHGADVVKVVASEAAMLTTTGLAPGAMVHGAPELTLEELRAIVTTATDLGRRVMCHAQDSESVRRSVAARVTSVEHAWLADEPAIDALAASGGWLVPTLVVTDVNRTLPGLTAVQRERQDLIEQRHRISTETAIRLGIRVATGTDTGEVGVTADMVWREIDLLRDHGASAMAAIKAATSAAARLLGVDGDTGTIEVGKFADLVLVEGDPLAELTTLAQPVAVWQGGRAVSGGSTPGALASVSA
jgi:imidazolonepropionase-like amidohydrolase